jgi:DNA modification methylase
MEERIKLMLGDNMKSLKELPDNSVDSIVTDPPYALTSIKKRFGKEGSAPAQYGSDGAFQRASKGFMGKEWDAEVPTVEFWSEVYRVLKPGGHVLSFGGTRTYHRMAVNIEDAGFEIRDQIMWIYGSGFPKSHNIGKAVDKFGGNNLLSSEIGKQLKEARTKRGLTLKAADELFCGGTSNYNWLEGRSDGQRIPNQELFDKIVAEWPDLKDIRDKVLETEREILGTEITNKTVMSKIGEKNEAGEYVRTKGQSPYEGWGTALKPANEPICLARKPLSEKSVAENVLKWGTGGLNIDASRIPFDMTDTNPATNPLYRQENEYKMPEKGQESNGAVSFTSSKNEISQEGRFPANVILDEEAGKILDEQSGNIKGGKNMPPFDAPATNDIKMNSSQVINRKGYDDKGGASRFFYVPKVSKKERNRGLDDFEAKTNRQKGHGLDRICGNCGTSMLKPQDCKCEEPDWITPPKKNTHPTVKPINLLTYLVRLVTPKNGVVMDCFMGSGSTGIAAQLEGFKFIGMEMDEDYFNIAETRINAYEEYRELLK